MRPRWCRPSSTSPTILGIVVVAEGVEEPVTAHWLRGKQCDIAQGYYFGRPTDRAHLPGLVEAAALPRLDVVAD